MTEIDEATADRIYRMRVLGLTARMIAEQVNVSTADVVRVVDERLPKLTNEFRALSLRLDLERLDQLTARCLEQAAKGSIAAGHLLVKVVETRADLLGTKAPLRIDPIQLVEIAGGTETSTENLRRVYFEELRGQRPAEPPPGLPN